METIKKQVMVNQFQIGFVRKEKPIIFVEWGRIPDIKFDADDCDFVTINPEGDRLVFGIIGKNQTFEL